MMSGATTRKAAWAAHIGAVTAAAVAGGVASGSGSTWYRHLRRPRWQPPASVFGPVWTGLYALIAYAGGTAWNNSSPQQRRRFTTAYAANLALNAGWTWTFFRARRLPLAAAHAAAIEVSTLDLIRRAQRSSPRAAAALVPYAVWNAFATALSTDLARRNRHA